MAAPSPQGEIEQSILLSREVGAIRTGSAALEGAVGTLPCSTRDRCSTIGDQSKRTRLNRSKADRADSTPGSNIHERAIARWARARARSVSRTHPKLARGPRAMAISKPVALHLRFRRQHQLREAQTSPQLGYARCVFRSARTLFVRRYRYLLSCMSTPAPVALTSTPLWVERSTTVTPA